MSRLSERRNSNETLHQENNEIDLESSITSTSETSSLNNDEKSVLLPGDENILNKRAIKNTLSSFFGLTIVFGVLNSSGALEPLIFDALSSTNDATTTTSSSSSRSYKIRDNLYYKSNNSYIMGKRSSVSSVDISWVFSINLFFLLGAGIFAGCKFDRSGGRSLTYSSCLLATIVMFCFAKSGHHLATFIVLYGIFGIAQGVLMTCCFSGLTLWYRKNLSTFSAVISLGGSIGGIVFPIFIRKSYAKFGFEKTILIYAGIIGFLGLCCCLLFDDNSNGRKEKLKKEKKNESFASVFKIYCRDTINLKYFFDFKFIVISIGLSAAEIGTSIVATYLTSYCTKKGYSKQEAYTFITVMNAFGVLGRSWGFIADKWVGRFQVICICMFISALANFIFLLAFGKHMWSMYLFCAIYGSSISGFLSLCPAAVSVLCTNNDFGKRFSTMYLFASCASIPLLEISGAIIGDQTSSVRYQYFWIFTSLILLVGSLCYFYLRMVFVGFKWKKY